MKANRKERKLIRLYEDFFGTEPERFKNRRIPFDPDEPLMEIGKVHSIKYSLDKGVNAGLIFEHTFDHGLSTMFTNPSGRILLITDNFRFTGQGIT